MLFLKKDEKSISRIFVQYLANIVLRKSATERSPKVEGYVIVDHVFSWGQFRWCTGARIYSWPDTLFIDVPPTGGNFVCETKWLRGTCHRSFMTHRAEPVRPIVTMRRDRDVPRIRRDPPTCEHCILVQCVDYQSWSCSDENQWNGKN